jgi:hypothetical protein
MKRKSVNLSDRDAEILEPFLEPGPQQARLAAMVGEESLPYSESAALRALAMLGARAVRSEQLRAGYEAWAASWDEEDQASLGAAEELASEVWRD